MSSAVEVEAAEGRRAVADRFPAIVTTPTGLRLTGRVVITRDELYVWSTHDDRIQLEYRLQLDGTPPTPPRRPWTVATGGGQFVIEKGAGCGCSSPLKRFVPWTPYRPGRP